MIALVSLLAVVLHSVSLRRPRLPSAASVARCARARRQTSGGGSEAPGAGHEEARGRLHA